MLKVGTVLGVLLIAFLIGVGLYYVVMWLIKKTFKETYK